MQLDGYISQYKNYPAAYGYLIKDEPDASQFSGLGGLVAHIHQVDPNHLAYINLAPDTWSASQLGAAKLYAYLSQYINTVQPALLSYDHYQFQNTSDEGTYLQNLGEISQASHRLGYRS